MRFVVPVVIVVLLLLSWGNPPALVSGALRIVTPAFDSAFGHALGQMAFDPNNQTVYIPDANRATILYLVNATNVSTDPTNGAPPPWGYSTLAGQDGTNGRPAPNVEIPPRLQIFQKPTGLVGWPYAGAVPSASYSAARPWVGLWVTDRVNNVVCFINFERSNYVTLAAGSSWVSGATDAVGALASLNGPHNLAWGRFLTSVFVAAGIVPYNTTTTWTSVVLWTELVGHCVRLGIPINNATREPMGHNGTTAGLPNMVLNVSSFAGSCGNVASVASNGPAYKQPILWSPYGLALTNPFVGAPSVARTNGTMVLFLAEVDNHRVSLIAPLWPPEARYLTGIHSWVSYAPQVVTLGRVQPSSSSNPSAFHESTLDIFIGYNVTTYMTNLSLTLRLGTIDGVHGSTTTPIGAVTVVNTTNTSFVMLSLLGVSDILFLPHGGNETLMLADTDGLGSATAKVLQFVCCLDDTYSIPMIVTDFPINDTSSAPPPSPPPTVVVLPGDIAPDVLGTPTLRFSCSGLFQMAYDAFNNQVFLAGGYQTAIYTVSGIRSVPVAPLSGTTWMTSVFALYRNGLPTLEESADASFAYINGIAGWYLPMPWSPSSSETSEWVGLWACDYTNHAVRFINFKRGNNVTLVAGSDVATRGGTDGIGVTATLNYPSNIAWGGFLASVVAASGALPPSTVLTASQMVSVVLWTEEGNRCLRQGIPVNKNTKALITDANALQNMTLNVSTFAGICSSPGSGDGYAYNRPVFYSLMGLVVVNPFPTSLCGPNATGFNSTTVIFVSDTSAFSVLLLAPLWPTSSRYVTKIFSSTSTSAKALSIGRVQPMTSVPASSEVLLSSVDVFIETYTTNVSIVAVSLLLNTTNGSLTPVSWQQDPHFLMTGVPNGFQALVVPHTAPPSGSLILLGGVSTSAPVLQFYCCLGPEYSTVPVWNSDNATKPSTSGASLPMYLTTFGTPSRLGGASYFEQMTYDPVNDTLYLLPVSSACVAFVVGATAVPTQPLIGTPWDMLVLTGKRIAGPASPEEVPGNAAMFNNLLGIVGWSPYAVTSTVPVRWAGLFLCDYLNNAIRFVNFGRGNNVTTVAGSNISGSTDGIGAEASLWNPQYVASADFLTARVADSGALPPVTNASTQSTSVILWAEHSNACIRQGIPVDQKTSTLTMGTDTLHRMRLNVSVFAGVCGRGSSLLGLTYRRATFFGPTGIAVVNPFPTVSNSSAVVFVSDATRLLLISPLWPTSARFLSLLKQLSYRGLTVARVRPNDALILPPSQNDVIIEIFATSYNHTVAPWDVPLQLLSNGTVVVTSAVPSAMIATFFTGVSFTTNTLLVPHRSNSSNKNDTLVVIGGISGSVMQFYCCLSGEYSRSITVTDMPPSPVPVLPPPFLDPAVLGTPSLPIQPTRLNQIAYDAASETMYFGEETYGVILFMTQVSTLPTTPLVSTPWNQVTGGLLAGILSQSIQAVDLPETPPDAARFGLPSGIVGWPRYAVTGLSRPSSAMSAATRFIGLITCDVIRAILRFINFDRGNNVTVLAGKLSGNLDGVGTAAKLNGPRNLAWGRFLTSVLEAHGAVLRSQRRNLTSSSSWTSVFVWSDSGNGCVRMGIPLYNTSLLLVSAEEGLQDMIFNVSSFVGLCGTRRTDVGPAFNRAVLDFPWGIAMINPIPTTTTTSNGGIDTSMVLFVVDFTSQQVVMVAPLWPPASRYLTLLQQYHLSGSSMCGVTVGRVVHINSSRTTATTSSLDLFVAFQNGNYSHFQANVTHSWAPYRGGSNGSRAMVVEASNATQFAQTNIGVARYVSFLPFGALGSLVVFSGNDASTPVYSALQFYCCVDGDYVSTGSLHLDDLSGNWHLRTVTQSQVSIVGSGSRSPSTASNSAFSASTSRIFRAVSRRPFSSSSSSITETTFTTRTRVRAPSRTAATRAVVVPALPQVVQQVIAATGSTASAAGSVAFVATSTVLGLQRLNGAVAAQNCPLPSLAEAAPIVTPPWLSNPGQWTIGGGAGAYWRASWVFQVFGNLLLGLIVVTITSLLTYCNWELWLTPRRNIPTPAHRYGTHNDDDDTDAFLASVLQDEQRRQQEHQEGKTCLTNLE